MYPRDEVDFVGGGFNVPKERLHGRLLHKSV